MKDETWGWLIGVGISKKFPPHVLAFMSAAYAATAGRCSFANGPSSVAGTASGVRNENA